MKIISREIINEAKNLFSADQDTKIAVKNREYKVRLSGGIKTVREYEIRIKRPGTILEISESNNNCLVRLMFRTDKGGYRVDKTIVLETKLFKNKPAKTVIFGSPNVQNLISRFREHTYTPRKIQKILIKPAGKCRLIQGFAFIPEQQISQILRITVVGYKEGSKHFVDPKVPNTTVLYQIECVNNLGAKFKFVTDAKSYVIPCTERMLTADTSPKDSVDLNEINELDLELIKFAVDNMAIGCLDTNRT